MRDWSTVLAADWSKSAGKREVYRASGRDRRIARVAPPADGWTVAGLLRAAHGVAGEGRVLVGVDAPLGVPAAYWRAAQSACRAWRSSASFVDWLPKAVGTPAFLRPHTRASDCCVTRPFFAPPPGRWSRRAWETAFGLPTLRAAERGSGAKPVFLLSGLPGLAGPAAVDVWRGLAEALSRPRAFEVWPFEDAGRPIVVAEMYPAALYASAIGRRRLAKTKADVRAEAVQALCDAPWAAAHGVTLDGLDEARTSEDAFDALLSVAALLRARFDGVPFIRADTIDPVAEGGILGIL